jgi:hypothetical protein
VLDRRCSAARAPPAERPHPGGELVEVERLDEVVVGAGVQARDAVGHRVARRDDEQGQVARPRAQRLEHCEAGPARQPEVEEQHLVHAGRERRLGGAAVPHPVDAVARVPEPGGDALADHGLVLGEQHAHRGRETSDGSAGFIRS